MTIKTKIRRITTAETVSAEMGDDGQAFTNKRGISLNDVCQALGASVEYRFDGKPGTARNNTGDVRFVFDDGSAIVVSNNTAWDIEGSQPWSWAGAE